MSMTISKNGEVTIAAAESRLDTTTAPSAESSLIEAIDGGAARIVIDLSATDYISSAGLRVFLKAAKTLHQKSGKIALCSANEQIREVLEMSGFLTMMSHHETLDAAIEAVV